MTHQYLPRRVLLVFALIAAAGSVTLSGCSSGPDESECRSYCERLGEYAPGFHCFTSDCSQHTPTCHAAFVDECTSICVDKAGSGDLDESCADHSRVTCSDALCCTSWYYSPTDHATICG